MGPVSVATAAAAAIPAATMAAATAADPVPAAAADTGALDAAEPATISTTGTSAAVATAAATAANRPVDAGAKWMLQHQTDVLCDTKRILCTSQSFWFIVDAFKFNVTPSARFSLFSCHDVSQR